MGRSVQGLQLSHGGYLDPGYALSLSDFGVPTLLPRSGGWFLRRQIPPAARGTDPSDPRVWFDGLGCYPYLACHDWSALQADIEALGPGMVSIAAAPDPFGSYTVEDLRRCFPSFFVHFKDHFVADLAKPREAIVSRHHRTYANRALKRLEIEFVEQPVRHLEVWVELFEEAARRRAVAENWRFSKAAFARQFELPGAVMSLAFEHGRAVAAHVQMVCGDTVHAHLAAARPEARALGADYALYDAEIRYYAARARWIDWGGEAGVSPHSPGLSAFKRGWSNTVRPAYFCGRILDPERYDQLRPGVNSSPSSYFPAYRQGEFA